MKRIFIIFIVLIIAKPFVYSQNFKLWNGDTINLIDENNFKQGKWVIFKDDSENIQSEGEFSDNKKRGVWKTYYTTGNIQSEITYNENKQNGYARIYHKNGKIAEEGTWVLNKWIGEYKSYYKNGQASYVWNYNNSGKRSGYQRYFHENGKVKIEGKWNDGKENGIVKEYYETGDIKTEKSFTGGSCDNENIKTYEKKATITKTEVNEKVEKTEKNVENVNETITNDKKVVRYFSGTGQHTFYNKNKQPYKEGYFENGALKNGKQYFYDKSGKLIKTAIIKEGKFVKYIENKN